MNKIIITRVDTTKIISITFFICLNFITQQAFCHTEQKLSRILIEAEKHPNTPFIDELAEQFHSGWLTVSPRLLYRPGPSAQEDPVNLDRLRRLKSLLEGTEAVVRKVGNRASWQAALEEIKHAYAAFNPIIKQGKVSKGKNALVNEFARITPLHRQGIEGSRETGILVWEAGDTDLHPVLSHSGVEQYGITRHKGFARNSTHPNNVTYIIHQIAPDSPLVLEGSMLSLRMGVSELSSAEIGTLITQLRDKHIQIINTSFSQGLRSPTPYFIPNLKNLLSADSPLSQKFLWVKSTDNEDRPFEETSSDQDTKKLFKEYPEEGPYPLPAILAIGIDRRRQPILTYPGSDQNIQTYSLASLAMNLKTADYAATSSFSEETGNSLSASTIAGVAALLPAQLSPRQRQQALLWSADRNFFVSLKAQTFSRSGSMGLGNFGIWLYEPEEVPAEGPSAWVEVKVGVDQQGQRQVKSAVLWLPFDPYFYGRGILNAERAYNYALKLLQHPSLPPQNIRQEVLAAEAEKRKLAAAHIQSWSKRHLKSLSHSLPTPEEEWQGEALLIQYLLNSLGYDRLGDDLWKRWVFATPLKEALRKVLRSDNPLRGKVIEFAPHASLFMALPGETLWPIYFNQHSNPDLLRSSSEYQAMVLKDICGDSFMKELPREDAEEEREAAFVRWLKETRIDSDYAEACFKNLSYSPSLSDTLCHEATSFRKGSQLPSYIEDWVKEHNGQGCGN